MKKSAVTAQVLEMLLENWGSFVSTGSWGPRIATRCGSAEQAYADYSSRAIWGSEEGPAMGRHKASDTSLGLLVEKALESAPMDWRCVLLHRYGHRRTGYLLAVAMNTSVGQVEALLVSAKAHVHEKLEGVGYAR